MPSRESRLWGFQKVGGPHLFWSKVGDALNRGHLFTEKGVPMRIWEDVANDLGISPGAMSEWKTRRRLPPVDYCFSLGKRMRMSVIDLLDPNMPYDPEPADFRQRVVNAILTGPRDRVEKIERVAVENPRALNALAELDTGPKQRR